MQLLLPIFPTNTILLSPSLGIFEQDGLVYYLHSGAPIFSHPKGDIQSFRYIICNLIDTGRCQATQVCAVLKISRDTLYRYLKIYRTQGSEGMFASKGKVTRNQKMHGQRLIRIQQMLDKGMSNSAIAKIEDMSEGTIRYNIGEGKLKKKPDRKFGR